MADWKLIYCHKYPIITTCTLQLFVSRQKQTPNGTTYCSHANNNMSLLKPVLYLILVNGNYYSTIQYWRPPNTGFAQYTTRFMNSRLISDIGTDVFNDYFSVFRYRIYFLSNEEGWLYWIENDLRYSLNDLCLIKEFIGLCLNFPGCN